MPSFTFLSTASDMSIGNSPPFFQSCYCYIIIGDFTRNAIKAVQMYDHLADAALFWTNYRERNIVHSLWRTVNVLNLILMGGNCWSCMLVLLYYFKTITIYWVFIYLLVYKGCANIENYVICIIVFVCSRHNHSKLVRKLGIECIYFIFLLFIIRTCFLIINYF